MGRPAPARHGTLRRVAVVGTSCSGKTTFSRRLAASLGFAHVQLDELHWRPGWAETPLPEFRDLVDRATAGESWIVDGNYSKVSDIIWSRATTLIWLDLPFHIVFYRAWARTLRRWITREKLWAGNHEILNPFDPDWIPWWVLRTHLPRRRRYQRMLSAPAHAHLELVRIRSVSESNRFIERPSPPGGGAVPDAAPPR